VTTDVRAGVDRLNALTAERASELLLTCCGSRRWAAEMTTARPFAGEAALLDAAHRIFARLDRGDWLEAFAAHPRIGGREPESAHAASARASAWSAEEQRGTASAGEPAREMLRRLNDAYVERFGYIFIVCATGLTGAAMLGLLEGRLGNDPRAELPIAAAEQQKITAIRLGKLLAALEAERDAP
jgi:OHCU decarboxylase